MRGPRIEDDEKGYSVRNAPWGVPPSGKPRKDYPMRRVPRGESRKENPHAGEKINDTPKLASPFKTGRLSSNASVSRIDIRAPTT